MRCFVTHGGFDPGSSRWTATFRVLDELDWLHRVSCRGVLLEIVKTSSRRSHPHSRSRMPHGSNAGTLRDRRGGYYSPSLLSGRYCGVRSR